MSVTQQYYWPDYNRCSFKFELKFTSSSFKTSSFYLGTQQILCEILTERMRAAKHAVKLPVLVIL